MKYREIISKQKLLLHDSISWWPEYFYHFTDIQNALGIFDKEWIFARKVVMDQQLM